MAPGTSARLNTIIQTTIKETWLIIEWYFGLKVDHYTVLRIYRDRSRHWKGDQNSVLQLQQSWTSMCVVLQWLRMQSIRFLGIWGNAPQEILKNNCEFGAIWVFNYCGALSIRCLSRLANSTYLVLMLCRNIYHGWCPRTSWLIVLASLRNGD